MALSRNIKIFYQMKQFYRFLNIALICIFAQQVYAKNNAKLLYFSIDLKKEVKENIEIALKYIENIEIQTNKV